MRVLVLGAGVIGTASAYYLAKAGYQVTVLERAGSVAEETSFANGGQLSFGYSSPWAAPDIPLKAIKWLFQRHAPLSIRPTSDIRQYLWLAKFLRNCSHKRYGVNKERMLRLARYSQTCLQALRQETGILYEGRQGGTTQLFRTAKELAEAQDDLAVLEHFSVPHRLLSPERIADVEPALASQAHKFTGALYLPEDETGDCRLFTAHLASKAADLGVEFRFNQEIWRFELQDEHIQGVWAEGVLHEADYYVLALGSYSPALLRPLGLKLPVYPLKGYSITLPANSATQGLRSTLMDESHKVVVTRFDERIRVAGMAEIMGHNLSLNPRREETLKMVVEDLFPGAVADAQTNFWTGLRPATPDGTPVIGATSYPNLFLNTGHGTLGWTMACGSGQLLADILSQGRGAISLEGLGIERY